MKQIDNEGIYAITVKLPKLQALIRKDEICYEELKEEDSDAPLCRGIEKAELTGEYVQDNVRLLLDTFCCEPNKTMDSDSAIFEIAKQYASGSYLFAVRYLEVYLEAGYNEIISSTEEG